VGGLHAVGGLLARLVFLALRVSGVVHGLLLTLRQLSPLSLLALHLVSHMDSKLFTPLQLLL
jgi:hypothetical protein